MNTSTNTIVFRAVRVFDGINAALTVPQDVVVRGNTIESVQPVDAASPVDPGARVIEGAGRVVMPGFSENPFPTLRRAQFYVSPSNAEGFPNSLLEAMSERQVSIEGHTYPLPAPFVVVATL